MSSYVTRCWSLIWGLWALLAALPAHAQLDSIPKAQEKAWLLPSAALHESRSIWVHLPADYASTDQTYPVLYVLDGGTHFKYAAALADYLADYDRNRLPKLIIVGIPNVDRGRDFTPVYAPRAHGQVDSSQLSETTGAALFLRFLQQELVPFIDQHYRTQPYRLLAGHSLGGLFAYYAKLKAPALFPATILISPAITGVNERLLNELTPFLNNHPTLRGKLFLTLGNENPTTVTSLARQLRAAPASFQWRYQPYGEENHFSVTAKSLHDALRFIYGSWFMDFYAATRLTYQDIEAHFTALSQEFGYPIEPTEEFVNNCGYTQLSNQHTAEAVGIFQQNVKRHPASANAYDSLGEAYLAQGATAAALTNYRKSLALNPHNEHAQAIVKKLTGSVK